MKILIVGGTFTDNIETVRPSGVVNKMHEHLLDINAFSHCISVELVNGRLINTMESLTNAPVEKDIDLTIWMPDITNEEAKHYPHKKQGSVLICSKVMREGYTRVDSVSRIFKMHGNAVIEIRKCMETNKYTFCLVDALANVWYEGDNIPALMTSIMAFVGFTRAARRVNTTRGCEVYVPTEKYFNDNRDNLQKLLDINRKLQHHIKTACGDRFFGNVSTRCQKLFPSARANEVSVEYTQDTMYVSPRNTDKESLTPEDMVLYFGNNDVYFGEKKPSVDSPAQARLYKKLPGISFMIHGHATIVLNNIQTTKHYKLCGDINEVDEVIKVVGTDAKWFAINLLGHGFLIGADTPETLESVVNSLIDEAGFKITNQ